MKKVKKPVWIVILILCLAVIIAGVIFLINYFKAPAEDGLTRKEFTISTSDHAAKPTETAATEKPTEPATEKPTFKTYGQKTEEAPEDWSDLSFDELREKNSDIYAWIYIPGTRIDYPVCQSYYDDNYYLNHNIYHQYQFSCTIYSQMANSREFDDRVTVLYGHNMLNGSMFADLHKFRDQKFFDKHNTVFIYTKDKLMTFLVYSVYTYDDKHILNAFNNMTTDEDFQRYLDSTLEPHAYDAKIRKGVELDTNNQILTLSTCVGAGESNRRLLVQGVLVDVQSR